MQNPAMQAPPAPNAGPGDPAKDPARALATLVQLLRRAREAENEAALGFVMVNETLRLLPYRQAALWRGGAFSRIKSLSGLAVVDPSAPYVQWLNSVFKTLSRDEGGDVRSLVAADLPTILAEDWPNWLPRHGLLLRLNPPSGHASGALLLARDHPWGEYERTLAGELAHGYAHTLAQFDPNRGKTRSWLRASKRLRWIAMGLLAVGLIPVRLSVLAPAEVVPRDPLLVRAPLDGVVEHVHVLPNQPVKAGAALLSLDTTALQSHYAVAQQAYDTALEQYRQSAQLAVTDDKGKLEMALRKGALEEKSVELQYTAEQLGRVQIKAERDGVAVFSDADDWMGKAVALGEKIMTLADPAKVELTVHLPATDSIAIAPGAEITLYPNADPTGSYRARVLTVAYRAEPTPDGVLAYRVKAAFADKEVPRIGLMGTAKIAGDRAPLIYSVLRKPLTAARQWLGW